MKHLPIILAATLAAASVNAADWIRESGGGGYCQALKSPTHQHDYAEIVIHYDDRRWRLSEKPAVGIAAIATYGAHISHLTEDCPPNIKDQSLLCRFAYETRYKLLNPDAGRETDWRTVTIGQGARSGYRIFVLPADLVWTLRNAELAGRTILRLEYVSGTTRDEKDVTTLQDVDLSGLDDAFRWVLNCARETFTE